MLAEVVIDRVDVPAPVTVVGLKLPVTPVGNPLTLKLTALLKLFSAPTDALYELALPAVTVSVDGLTFSVKSGARLTTSEAVAEWDKLPLVPFKVRV